MNESHETRMCLQTQCAYPVALSAKPPCHSYILAAHASLHNLLQSAHVADKTHGHAASLPAVLRPSCLTAPLMCCAVLPRPQPPVTTPTTQGARTTPTSAGRTTRSCSL